MTNSIPNIDLVRDIYSFYNIEGKLTLFYQPKKAVFFYPDHSIDLLSGERDTAGAVEFFSLMEHENLDYSRGSYKVILSFYELGHYFEGSAALDLETPLGVWIEYECSKVIENRSELSFVDPPEFEPLSQQKYDKAFCRGREHLLRGDCYQYNLTFAQEIKWKGELAQFIERWFKSDLRGEFANLTSVADKLYYSNSPECLFDLKVLGNAVELHTRPIKGTVSTARLSSDAAWEELKSSSKNESELYMITDLLRNDLNRIEKPIVQVVATKKRLDVPGLVHSFSHLKVRLSKKVNFLQLMKAIFPGGSITGAPKKRVMEIIRDLEKSPRGFYCGSSILKTDESFKASINIRSGVLDKKTGEVLYWSGGGVTLQSQCRDEYQELLDKTNSFIHFLS